ncbi:MAG TPA: Uma2 family endonuclease [Planctomycetaceae bacterium]|nr:Uma2 family endonuclease [Planctomycetaceae bacterium]
MGPTILMPGEDVAIPADTETLYEVVDGRVVELEPMGAFESWLSNLLKDHLSPFVRSHGLGRVVHEMLFNLLPIRQQRRPDLAFVSYGRWPKRRAVPRKNAWPVVPDLAVEVISPTNSMDAVLLKIREYFQAGVQQVWVVLPEEEQVYVYDSPTTIRVLTRDDELTSESILPGYRLPLAELFERLEDVDDEDTAAESATDRP